MYLAKSSYWTKFTTHYLQLTSCFWLSSTKSYTSSFVLFVTMKKYSLIWLIWLCVIALWAWAWLYRNPSTSLPFLQKAPQSLLRYLPNTVDQVMKIDINPETINFIRNSNQGFDEQSFTNVLESLTSIVIAQAPKWADDVYSVLLLAGNEKFSIDQVQALGLLYFDTGYESKQIEDNMRLYGDKASVAYYSSIPAPLSNEKEIQTVLKQANEQKASVLFFSKPGEQLGNDPLTLAFAKKLQYTALYGTPSINKSKWTMVLQFSGTNFNESGEIFTPQHTDKLTDNTVVYLEGKNILSTFWLTDTQFSLWFPLLLGQSLPWIDKLLSVNQISDLYEALNKQLGIILNVTENTFGIWLHLRFWTAKAYDSLLTLQPARRSLASSFMWSGNIHEENTENSWTLSIDLPNQWTSTGNDTGDAEDSSFSLPLITLERNANNTTLSILPSTSEGTSIKNDLKYESNSLVTFRYDPNPLMQMAWVNPLIGNFVGQMEMLWTWVILWELHIDNASQQVVISFETK